MTVFRFEAAPALIGVVHLEPLPGSPRSAGTMGRVLERAQADAAALVAGGCDALIVENFGDVPFHRGAVPAETVAAMTRAVSVVRDVSSVPVGVNVLRNDARAALGICAATGAQFLRVNVHVGAAVTDQGLLQGEAAETVRARATLSPDVALLCDVHVKHATPLGSESIADSARDCVQRGLADYVIVTGVGTGEGVVRSDLGLVRDAVGDERTLIGSGVTLDTVDLVERCGGAIIGSAFERDGRAGNPVEEARVEQLVAAIRRG